MKIRNFLFLVVVVFSSCVMPQNNPVQHKPLQEIKAGKPILINNISYNTLVGFIDVPEDYNAETSRRLSIPFFIVKSPSQNPAEPVFWLDGGPGASNIVSESNITSSSPAKLLANHDFVCIGYRGVDGSTILNSKEINKAMKGLNSKMLSEESISNIVSEINVYTNKLKDKEIDISNYNILNVIEDIEYARKFLGYNSINLISVSYGTRIALLYSYKYPKSLKRTMMIGACPPGYFLTRPEQAENTLEVYDSIYKSQNGEESIRENMKVAFKNLPKKWSFFTLDKDKIKAGATAALYNRGFAVLAFEYFEKAAKEGDYSGLFALQKIQDRNNNSVIGDVFAKTVSADLIVTQSPQEGIDNSILGKNIAYIYEKTAKSWNIRSIPESFTKCQKSDCETLVISGDLDFRTPAYIVNQELMPFLPNGKHIILKNMSHTDILMNVMKNQDFLYYYFEKGEVHQNLVDTIKQIDFVPKSKLGKAKIFVMGLIM